MKHYLLCVLSLVFIFVNINIKEVFPQQTGLWVAGKIDKREAGKDSDLKMKMILTDKKGRERKRTLFVIRKDFNGEDKLLLKFTYPKDISGTSFLVWEHKGEDNERFLYLPALGRIRRIATNQKDENFAGTDFSYEDISGRKLEDYTYRLKEELVVYKEQECYLLISYPKDTDSKYPKVLSWVRKDNFVTLKADYYNNSGDIEKTYKCLKLKQIDKIWTALELLMENHKTGHKTLIKVEKVKYNQGLSAKRFEKKELKR
ncbi:outer membrane lipoprotein-sorting protein [bacterium]|nr:outer membrane lipoprotein-sorting protein [bacterium]